MDQLVSLNRDIIIKASDCNINYLFSEIFFFNSQREDFCGSCPGITIVYGFENKIGMFVQDSTCIPLKE